MSVQEKSPVLDSQKPLGHRWGVITAIFVGAEATQPMTPLPEVRAVAGVGLEGDRYSRNAGTFTPKPPSQQLTLIESEAVAAAERDYKIEIATGESRRNLLTSGIALNHLVGREFLIGDVRCRGIRLCEPCDHLEKLTGKAMIKALRHRGGLRAEILSDGIIKIGDTIAQQD